ncbi:hypothetical protein PFISCL1PPCAC_7877, partial [Pristionchus fissidentatus]
VYLSELYAFSLLSQDTEHPERGQTERVCTGLRNHLTTRTGTSLELRRKHSRGIREFQRCRNVAGYTETTAQMDT